MVQASLILQTTVPFEREVAAAMQSQRSLAAYLGTQFETKTIQAFEEKNHAQQGDLPKTALRPLVNIFPELAEGNAVKVEAIYAVLTAYEATDILNASRPHLVKLLKKAALPFHKSASADDPLRRLNDL